MKRNNKKGFTIVELVIVIAVIAILSAVLIPTFGSVITDANKNAAQQEARNAYTKYIQACTDDDTANLTAADLDKDLVIVVDNTYYFTIVGGQIAEADSTVTHTGTTDLDSSTNIAIYHK